MDLLGEQIAQLIDMRKVRGVRAEGDDLILSPAELFPAPHIRGRLSSIDSRGNRIALKYGGPPEPKIRIPGNYMAYRGARLRFSAAAVRPRDGTRIFVGFTGALDRRSGT